MSQNSQTSFSNDFLSRVVELELSQELCDIYSHPHWMQFMEMLNNSTCEVSLYALRQWAESHYQLAPLIQWFHRCTAKYGLCFDIYSYIPPSRLILQKQCQEKVSHYKEMLRKCERKLAYYQELEQMLVDVTDNMGPTPRHSEVESSPSSAQTSCWSILTSHTSLMNDKYCSEPITVQNPPVRKYRTTLPPLETIYLPEVAHCDLTP